MKIIYLFRHSQPDKSLMRPTCDIPLSQEGRDRIISLRNQIDLDNKVKIISSPYRRARETAQFLGTDILEDARLIERKIGSRESFTKEQWASQYIDSNLCDVGGESFCAVRERMTAAIDDILSQMQENEMVVIVSHAAAICAYLQQFCKIQVTDLERKYRRIEFQNEVILDGAIQTPSCFQLTYEETLSEIKYID